MSLFRCVWRTVLYYTVRLAIFAALYHVYFSLKDVFISVDVLLFWQYRYTEIPRALACLTTFIMYVISIDSLAGVFLNVARVSRRWDEIVKMGFSASYDGPQGVGKTRCLVYDAFVMQAPKYRNLKFDTYVDAPIGAKIKKDYYEGKSDKYVRFKSRFESVAEYEAHPEYLELIYSNFGIYRNGKKARSLKREHFTQQERIFESNIKVGAELDNMFPNVLRKKNDIADEVNLIDEFVGLDRQYTDGVLLSDTHRTKSVFISFRDCMQVKYHLLEHEYKYTPRLLKWIYEKLGDKYFKKLDKILEKTLKEGKDIEFFVQKAHKYRFRRAILVFFQRNIRAIGFTKIYYQLEQGAAGFSRPGKDVKFFVLANDVPYYYDDRGLQKDYLPLGFRQLPKADAAEDSPKKRGRKKKSQKSSDQSQE